MFEVSVSGWFAAAHQLRFADGTLEPLHGHNWQVQATFAGAALDASGLLLDFVPLKRALDAALGELHDRNLNELDAFAERNPSAENVALWLAQRLAPMTRAGAGLQSVSVEESPGCVARYRPA